MTHYLKLLLLTVVIYLVNHSLKLSDPLHQQSDSHVPTFPQLLSIPQEHLTITQVSSLSYWFVTTRLWLFFVCKPVFPLYTIWTGFIFYLWKLEFLANISVNMSKIFPTYFLKEKFTAIEEGFTLFAFHFLFLLFFLACLV